MEKHQCFSHCKGEKHREWRGATVNTSVIKSTDAFIVLFPALYIPGVLAHTEAALKSEAPLRMKPERTLDGYGWVQNMRSL